MYEAPAKARNQLAIRKSPSMPMLDIAIIGGSGDVSSYMDSSSALLKCGPLSSGRKTPTPIHRKLKSAGSLCAGILVCTVVLFVLVALDPAKVAEEPWRVNSLGGPPLNRVALPRYRSHWASNHKLLGANSTELLPLGPDGSPEPELFAGAPAALEGMGMLFRRGTGAMTQLVVAHVAESTTAEDLRLFLRGLHRSGTPAHADVVLLFPFRPVAKEFRTVIHEEETYFQKLLLAKQQQKPADRHTTSRKLTSLPGDDGRQDDVSVWGTTPHTTSNTLPKAPIVDAPDNLQPEAGGAQERGHPTSRKLASLGDDVHERPKVCVFNSGAYTRSPPVAEFTTSGRPDVSIWGRRHNDTTSHSTTSNALLKAPIVDAAPDYNLQRPEGDGARAPDVVHYGAVVGFDVQELDPDDALSGFVHSPPIHLRRWLCYQMLLGMVRHRYRHVLVTEITGVVILADALASLKKKDASQLHLFATAQKWSDLNPNGTNNNGNDEFAYGKGVWNLLDEDEKRKKVISTGVILGGVRPVRSVAAAMATEIVRVALLRKSRKSFRDASLLSYLVHKSSALGRKVASHSQVHESGTLTVNLLPGTPRSISYSFEDIFFRRNGNRHHGDRSNESSRFAVIQGLKNEGISEERRNKILESLRRDICQSQNDREIYTDCYTNS